MSEKSKDHLFLDPQFLDHHFQFDVRVADVFDDMISRSIPLYAELQSMIVALCKHYTQQNSHVYDLGCSTGTTLALLSTTLTAPGIRLVGLDASAPMIARANHKLSHVSPSISIEFGVHDLCLPYAWNPCSVVIINLVLQFLPHEKRDTLLHDLYRHLLPGGAVIVIEKITPDSISLAPLYSDIYHDFKRQNGYSQLEIDRKKKALATSLFPLTPSQNKSLLSNAGFAVVEPFFQWYNFIGLLAVK